MEIAPGMVVYHVENDRQTVQMAEIHQAAELVRGAVQLRGRQRGLAPSGEQGVDARQPGSDFRRGTLIIVLRRKVVGAVIAQAERGLKLHDRQQLEGGDAEVAQVGQARNDVEELPGLLAARRRPEGAHVQLVEDEVVELRGTKRRVMPRVAGGIDARCSLDSARRVGCSVRGRKGRAWARRRRAEHVELIGRTVLESRPKTGPAAVPVTGQEVVGMGRGAAEVADEVDTESVGAQTRKVAPPGTSWRPSGCSA